MMNRIQASHYSPGMVNIAAPEPIALNAGAGLADPAGIPLVRIANARADHLTHPWAAREAHAVQVSREMDKAFGNEFLGASTQVDASGEAAFDRITPAQDDLDRIDTHGVRFAGPGPGPGNGAARGVQPVLSASAMETLHVCAGTRSSTPRNALPDGRNHPVFMPEGRSERAQVCRDIVNGSLLGTGGRNGTVPFDPSRDDVASIVADTARRWTGKPALAGKKEWSKACEELEPPATFIAKLNDRLQQGSRVLPSQESTAWMLRVGFAEGLPMHQAMVRADLPPSVGMGTDEWVKLALGIEQVGERHWALGHAAVIDAAALPATNTKAFTALATSLSARPPHIATQRLRNQLTTRGVPTAPASATSESSTRV